MLRKIINFIWDAFITYVSLLMIAIAIAVLSQGLNGTTLILIIASVGLNSIRLIDKRGKTNER